VNVPAEIGAQIRSAICRPEGSLTFEYSSAEAFKKEQHPALLLQIPAGGHLFRLERAEGRRLQFYHSSPGTGTRVATIELGNLPDFDRAFLAFAWSPEEVHFHCRPRIPGGKLLSAKAEASSKQYRIGADGSVFQIGGAGAEVMEVRVRQAGVPVLAPTALDAWTSTRAAIDVLGTGRSDQGFLFETALASLTLSALVTGLEAYAKTRFIEIETEGVPADSIETFHAFASNTDRESDRLKSFEAEAADRGQSIIQRIVETGMINFQSYDHLKRAFRSAYGIKLGEIGIDSQSLAALQQFIRYRHRIVHVSPLLSMLNGDVVPPEEPVFANRALVERAVKCFDNVVTSLHRATLSLRPSS